MKDKTKEITLLKLKATESLGTIERNMKLKIKGLKGDIIYDKMTIKSKENAIETLNKDNDQDQKTAKESLDY